MTSVSVLGFCDLVYTCGCRAAWAGAAEACNMHQALGPHCPWCSYGFLGGAIPFAAILLVQATVAFWPGKGRYALRLAGVFVAFPTVGGLAALLFGLVSGYWTS